MVKFISAVGALGLCLACRSEDVDLRVKVIVPAEIPSVSSGLLRLQLWAYDPQLADAPASLIDTDSALFAHRTGERQELSMSVKGVIPSGTRYLTVRGYELAPNGETYILWDGIQGTGTPSTVVMRPVVTVVVTGAGHQSDVARASEVTY